MLIPLKLAGLALAGKMLMSKTNKQPVSYKYKRNVRTSRHRPRPLPKKRQKPVGPNPLQNLLKGLSSSLSKLTQPAPKEDYNAVVKDFLPPNSKLLLPQYPVQTKEVQLADIDGDSQNEIIASYKLDEEITTLILKKQNEKWNKLFEFKNTGYNTLHFVGFTDVIGTGRKQLLLGFKVQKDIASLHGYSLENNELNRMFVRDYNRIEILEPRQSKDTATKTQVALWNKTATNTYHIEVLHWNGSDLESMPNVSPYYFESAVPYFAQRAQQTPQNPYHWYNLADALIKADMPRDALMAIDFGMNLHAASPSTEEFLALKNKILKK